MPAPRAHVENTRARGASTHGVFQRVTHHTPHHKPPQQHDHHTTRQRDRDRETEKEDRDKERRGDEREEDKKIEGRREKIHFQCGGAWPFFIDGVLFLVNPVCARGYWRS